MNSSCPISNIRVDSNFVRVVALEVAIISIILLLTQNIFFSAILLFDFSVRVLKLKKFSILAILASFIIRVNNIKPKMCDEAPKKFALMLGFITTFLFTILFMLNYENIASILVVILIICALLEAFFNYCLGCKIYNLLKYIRRKVWWKV